MKKPNVLISILKLAGIIVAGWFLWLMIFAMTLPEDADGAATELFPGATLLLGTLTGLAIWAWQAHVGTHRALQVLKAKSSNIQVVQEREDGLLDKANRVVEKYMGYESTVQVGVAALRSSGGKSTKGLIRNGSDFQTAIENYPELKANEGVMKLLEQINDCENTVANFKIEYNEDVAHYNTKVLTMPGFLRKLFKFEEAGFYSNATADEDEITDEMLGI